MKKSDISYKIYIFVLLVSLLILTGCLKKIDNLTSKQSMEIPREKESIQIKEPLTQEMPQISDTIVNKDEEKKTDPIITEADWSNYFDGINGAAVIYDSAKNCYQIYNRELANTRRSPCSTFKIISSLIALENRIIKADNSTRVWSGENFWNEEWNQDIGFSDAFHASCVWYFREIIDEIGRDVIQEELNKLQYGNCDISDWEGRLNTNNNNPALTGFWIESSLLISPKEQAEVMERIFNEKTDYSKETISQLKQVMLLPKQNETDIFIYGKTGMGKAHGIVVDSWFTGFADKDSKRISFCVYLGKTNNKNVSSSKAREIAIKIISDQLTFYDF